MARPREFDRDAALAGAIRVFADRGYAGASTDALLDGMRISRQSMYDTFGDKRRLYLECLQRYSGDSTAEIIGAMHAQASAHKGLEAALLAFAARPPDEACLGVSAVTEYGQSDREVSAITDAAGTTLLSAFERLVRKGQDDGAFARDIDARGAAQFLASTLNGLKLSARAGASPAALRDVVRMALRSLL